ncbi:hypothetical protein X801_10633, partial [Opisthorchis viverrini]
LEQSLAIAILPSYFCRTGLSAKSQRRSVERDGGGDKKVPSHTKVSLRRISPNPNVRLFFEKDRHFREPMVKYRYTSLKMDSEHAFIRTKVLREFAGDRW